MIGLILRIVAFILFVIAAHWHNLGSVGQLSLACWGLACWVLATVVGGWGPSFTLNRAG